MNIAKAYQMLLSAHGARNAGTQNTLAAGHGSEPWLSAGIYRAVSRTTDLLERIGSRGDTQR